MRWDKSYMQVATSIFPMTKVLDGQKKKWEKYDQNLVMILVGDHRGTGTFRSKNFLFDDF